VGGHGKREPITSVWGGAAKPPAGSRGGAADQGAKPYPLNWELIQLGGLTQGQNLHPLSILLTVLSQKVVKIEITLEIFDISRIIFAAGLLVMRPLSHEARKLLVGLL